MEERHSLLIQIVRYMIVGGLGTAANAVFFLALREGLDPVPSNLIALIASTFISTEVNRRFTFGGVATRHWRNSVQNGGTVLFYAFYSSAVLLLLAMIVERPSPALEAAAVAVASLLGGSCRFLVMRYWVFSSPTASAGRAPVRLDRGRADRPTPAL